jgi:tRNA A-37 threonylcarbamoyl transferase component Bud32
MAEQRDILCPRCRKVNLPRARFCQACGVDVVLNNEQPGRDERRYRLTRVIKAGGQGAVYEGIDQHGRIYAVKEMLDRSHDPRERAEALERFNSEAELLQRLSHQRIPRVYSHFNDDGRHYLAMDFVRGEDLEQILERSGRLPEARVLELAAQICDVLSYLHACGLIYRDMKPSNVMIEPDGGVKLIDFGIAKLFHPTERGTQIGTPGYAPPEQYQGLATPQSDVFALAATMHHLLTGRDPTRELPFVFPPAQTLVPAISTRTSEALERALRKVATERFATINAFWTALRPLQTVQPVRPPAQLPPAQASTAAVRPAVAPRSSPPPVTTVQPRVAAARPPAAPPTAATAAAPAAPTAPPAVPAPRVTARATRQRAGAVFGRIIAALILAALLLAGISQRERIVTLVTTLLPTVTAPAAPAVSQRVTYTLEVQLPTTADTAAVRAAFDDAFQQRARAEFGPATVINRNVPPSYVGGTPTVVTSDGTLTTYQVQMTGFVSPR